MPIKITMKLDGLQALAKRLEAIDKKVAKKAIKAAINQATKILTKEVKARVPVDTGLLRRSIGRKVKTYRQSGLVIGIVGPRANIVGDDGDKPSKYGSLVEFGTSTSPARPFLRPAFDAAKDRMLAAMRDVLREAIEAQGESVSEGEGDE